MKNGSEPFQGSGEGDSTERAPMLDDIFRSFFEPRSIALFGSVKPGKIGYEILASIREGGFAGKVYPINPTEGVVLGYPIHPSLSAVPGKVDLAVICLPKRAVIDAVTECGKKGFRLRSLSLLGFLKWVISR